MTRDEVKDLHYISPIANLASICEHGILCNRLAAKYIHESIADTDVQVRRQDKRVTGTEKTIHDFANLYFDAHNPMLSRRRAENLNICIVCVSPDVLDLPGAVIADMNAARDAARFYDVTGGLAVLDATELYARVWLHPNDLIAEDRHKALKCAEVLVPDRVSPKFLTGILVATLQVKETCEALKPGLPIKVRGDIFFW